nr:hypothetical protein [Tanacetum cinerariifolium]
PLFCGADPRPGLPAGRAAAGGLAASALPPERRRPATEVRFRLLGHPELHPRGGARGPLAAAALGGAGAGQAARRAHHRHGLGG